MPLLLLPNVLDETLSHESFLPKDVDVAISLLDGLIAESEKGARRFLRRFSFSNGRTFRDIPLKLLNEHTEDKELKELLAPILQGQTWGLASDCGLPCLADPGAKLIFQARKKNIAIQAFVGPSSIVLALMLSGFSAQRFAFNGYLPKEEAQLNAQIKLLQTRSKQEDSTQLCIETPYRNVKLFNAFLKNLNDETYLCVAADLTAPTQYVETQMVREWKKSACPEIDKRPAVFLLRSFV